MIPGADLDGVRKFKLETCMGVGITGIPRNSWNPSGMDTNCGTPAGMENISRDSRESVAVYLTSMVHLHQQANSTSIYFMYRTLGACLIRMITQTETSTSVVGNFY